MELNKFAVFNINVMTTYADSFELTGLMMIPSGFLVQKREMKFAIPLCDIENLNSESELKEQISTLYEFDDLIDLVATLNFCEYDECREYKDLNSYISICHEYNGEIVSEQDLADFLIDKIKLKHLIKITG